MRLKNLHIRSHFKNIGGLHLDFEPREGTTIIIGNNGSGKSNILEAISEIFSCLYRIRQRTVKPSFYYKLVYECKGRRVEVVYDNRGYEFIVDDVAMLKPLFIKNASDYLPTQVICSYSGEEERIWHAYYAFFYNQWRSIIRNNVSQGVPAPPLHYINKYYWPVALLTFIYASRNEGMEGIANFLRDDLEIRSIDKIQFTFRGGSSYERNSAVGQFIQKLNPDRKTKLEFKPDELKHLDFGYEKEFFNLLSAAWMPKQGKLIGDI